MADLGDPSSYMALEKGTPVYASDETELGRVEHVIADTADDIFEGIVLDTSRLPGGHRYVDETQVAHIYTRGVVTTISAEEGHSLPEPEKHASSVEVGADDMVPDHMSDRLKKAWHHMKGQS